MTDGLTFDQWCDEIDRICRDELEFDHDYTKGTGRECWRQGFDDGETPRQALESDMSYWE